MGQGPQGRSGRPGTPRSIPEPQKPGAQPSGEQGAQQTGAEMNRGSDVSPFPHWTEGEQPKRSDSSNGGGPGTVAPRDVWQLATWAVTPPYDAQEAAQRREQVRSILLGLVDQITGENEGNGNSGGVSSNGT